MIKKILSYRPGRLAAVAAVAISAVITIGGLTHNPAEKEAALFPKEEDREKIIELIENYADEKAALVNSYDFYRYVIDWEHEKADIWYYAWTSDPHVTVWKEEKYYEKSGEEYRVTDGSLEYMDGISSKEEFDKAYRIQGKYLFVDYEENGFADAISYQIENGTSAADNTVYGTPQTAAEYILNLTGGEGRVEGNYSIQAMVRYLFADGSEIMIPMYLAEENIWVVDVAVWNAGAPD